jgi:glucan phosphoethanolaminetransferase (alkaline phosphatase superfamily)
METNGKIANYELNVLIHKLKNEDERYARISKSLQILYWVLAPIYLILITRDIVVKSSVESIVGSFCFLFGMIAFALLFSFYYRDYKFVDYAQPTLVMLKKAARRYKPFYGKGWLAFVGVILLNIGLSLHSLFESDLLTIQIVYWGVMIAAVLIGLGIWWVRYKPIRDEALQLVREMES